MKALITFLILAFSLQLQAQNFEIYVSDAGNFNNPPWQILKFDQNGQNPTAFISTNLNWPQDILFIEDSNQVLISNLGTNRINIHDATTGAFIKIFAQGMSGPTRMKFGPDSLLYVLQWSGNGKVKRYYRNGNFVDDFTSIGVPQSIGMDWDAQGNLYVSSYNGDNVRKFDTAGVDMGIFISTNLLGPTNIWFDTNGDMLVSDYDGTAVKRFAPNGNYLGNFLTGLSKSEGYAYMPNGNILIGNGASSSVKMFDSSGNYLSDLIAGGAGSLKTPNAVVIRPVSSSTGINEKSHGSNTVRPNIGRKFMLDPAIVADVQQVDIYSIAGQLVETRTALFEEIELSQYNCGMYLFNIEFDDGSRTTERIVLEDQ